MTASIRVDDLFLNETGGFANFVFRLSEVSAQTVTVAYTIVSVTAGTNDLPFGSGVVTFQPGEIQRTLQLPITNDTTAENLESFALRLSNPVNATLASPRPVGYLYDSDQPPSAPPRVRLNDAFADESDGVARVVVSLDRPATGVVTIDWATEALAASAGADYTSGTGRLSFAPGETVKVIEIAVTDDAQVEGDEAFRVVLSNPVGVVLDDPAARVTIGMNDATPTNAPALFVRDVMVNEATGFAEFVVQLSAPGALPVSVSASTVSVTAGTNDIDFESMTVSFDPGQTLRVLRLPLFNDATAESVESIQLRLSNATNAAISDAAALAFIFDNDQVSVPAPNVSITDLWVDETEQTARLVVALDRPSSGVVSIDYATVGGTAIAGDDFTAAQGRLVFAPGDTLRTVWIDLVDDAQAESDETFTVRLSNAAGANLVDPDGTVVIGGNDGQAENLPSLRIHDTFVNETSPFADVVVQLDAPSTQTVSVSYTTASVSAGTNDVEFLSGVLSFLPGQTTASIRMPVFNDTVIENTEMVLLRLTNATNAAVADAAGLLFIHDNDGTPVAAPSLAINDAYVDENTGLARFQVTLDRPSNQVVSVGWTTVNGNASAGADYLAASGTLRFAPGQTVLEVPVAVLDDARPEPDETFMVQLSAPSGASLADAVGVGMIGRNDAPTHGLPAIIGQSQIVGEADDYLEFVLQLSQVSALPVSVAYTIRSAGAGTNDIEFLGGTAVFDPGETVFSLRLPVFDDTGIEALESVNLALSQPTNATLASTSLLGSIVDNDSGAAVSQFVFGPEQTARREDSGAFLFEVRRLGDVSQSAFVNWSVGSTMADGADFGAAALPAGRIDFAAGERAKTVSLSVAADGTYERHESFTVTLSGAFGAVIGQTSIQGEIQNDDTKPRASAPAIGKDGSFLFDPVYYLWRNPDLIPTVSLDAAAGHYLGTGAAQGRAPNSWFDATYYENRWPDLTPLGLDDATLFQHFNLFGVWEGRSPGPKFQNFDGNRYLADNPDVAAYVDAFVADFLGSRTNGAIAHYIIYGAAEQRAVFDLAGTPITIDYLGL